MQLRYSLRALASVLIAVPILSGCMTRNKAHIDFQSGESCVFIGEQEANLAHLPKGPVRIRNSYLGGGLEYEEGRDFVVNRSRGTLRRSPGSRLPDFRTNMLYGRTEFDHSQFPGFGNSGFFGFADYEFVKIAAWPQQKSQVALLPKTQDKLKAGQSVKLVAYGDSITAGGDSTRPSLIFWQRWADYLQQKYPQARVTAVNAGTIGDSTAQGLSRLKSKVLDQKPDLVLIGFGLLFAGLALWKGG